MSGTAPVPFTENTMLSKYYPELGPNFIIISPFITL